MKTNLINYGKLIFLISTLCIQLSAFSADNSALAIDGNSIGSDFNESFSGGGVIGGGGGDSFEGVFRDFIEHEKLEPIEDNLEYLDSIPKFRKLIHQIAAILPSFALRIIDDLNTVAFYPSKHKLPMLPYHQTSINEVEPDTQHALRFFDEIIIGPKFTGSDRTPNRFVHESLHGLLKNNWGPLHHQRVRFINNYIYKNLQANTLTKENLITVLKNNHYKYTRDFNDKKLNFRAPLLFNQKTDKRIRCFLASSILFESKFEIYEKLNCIETRSMTQPSQNEDMLDYLNEKFPTTLKLFNKDLHYNTWRVASKDMPKTSNYKLQNAPWWSFKLRKVRNSQKNRCFQNKDDLEKLKDYLKDINEKKVYINKLIKVTNNTDSSPAVKLALKDFFVVELTINKDYGNPVTSLEKVMAKLKEWENLANKRLATGEEFHKSCKKMYTKLMNK